MAGISVRSGVMVFGDQGDPVANNPRAQKKALKVLVVGDFAGVAPRSQPLEQRKHLRLDADTFDDVFARMGVAIQLPFDDQPVRFASLDDMHPDHLYDNVSLFNRYRSLRAQLQSPAHFAGAVAQLSREGLIDSSSPQAEAGRETNSGGATQNLLDSLLSGAVAPARGFAEQLIRQTVAPYLQPKEHPKVAEYVAAVDEAMGQVMRKIMHAGPFQKLEASWRGVDLLLRRLDLDRQCHLFLLDMASSEFTAESASVGGSASGNTLAQNLALHAQSQAAYDVIVFDGVLSASVIEMLLALAQSTGAVILTGGDIDFAAKANHTEQWAELRLRDAADQLFLACPRTLLRLPYGKRTAAVESFAFEELPQEGAHEYYLWGNGAYLLLLALAAADGATVGACPIGNLPLHVYRDDDGDEALKPCAEHYLGEQQVTELEDAGFTVLQSVQNSNSVMIQRWRSLSSR